MWTNVLREQMTAIAMQHVRILLAVMYAPAEKALQEMEHFVLVCGLILVS